MPQKIKFLDRGWLKIIAFVCMMVDHFACGFLSPGTFSYTISRDIGRVALPVFLVLFVYSFGYVSDKKHTVVLLIVSAILSEPVFDIVVFKKAGLDFAYNNIMFSWLLVFLMFCLLDQIQKNEFLSGVAVLAAQVLVIAMCSGAGECLNLDYGMVVPLASGVGYLLVDRLRFFQEPCYLFLILFLVITFLHPTQAPGIAGFFLFLFYDPGKKPVHKLKYLYYFGYPAHLAVFSAGILLAM